MSFALWATNSLWAMAVPSLLVFFLNFSLFPNTAVCGAKPGNCHTADIIFNDLILPVSQGGEDIISWAFQAIIQQHFNTKSII